MLTYGLKSKKFFDRAGRFLHLDLDYDQAIDGILLEILDPESHLCVSDYDAMIDKMSDEEFTHILFVVLDIYRTTFEVQTVSVNYRLEGC